MNNLTSGQYLRQLRLLHTSLMIGCILFSVVVVVLINTGAFPENTAPQLHGVLQFLVPAISVAAIFGSALLFKKRLESVQGDGLGLRFKLNQYRSACILRWATLEGAVLFATIGLLLTQEYYYAVFIFLLLVFFFLYAPSPEKIKVQLNLDGREQDILDDEYAELN